jgi:hypothetical protein
MPLDPRYTPMQSDPSAAGRIGPDLDLAKLADPHGLKSELERMADPHGLKSELAKLADPLGHELKLARRMADPLGYRLDLAETSLVLSGVDVTSAPACQGASAPVML